MMRCPLPLLLVLATACGSQSPAPAPAPTQPAPTPNLGFEQGDQPYGWHVYGRAFTSAIDAAEKHEGEQSLKLTFEGQGSFGAVASDWPIAELRGKRVRVSVQLQTRRTIAGWGRVWVDVRGPSSSDGFERVDQRLWGQIPWTPYEITVDVPADAESFHYGALLAGSGEGWIDGFAVEVISSVPRSEPAVVSGTVVDDAGKPVLDAIVASVAISSYAPDQVTRTGASGEFTLHLVPGAAGITVTAPGYNAAYLTPEEVATKTTHAIALTPATHRLTGRIALDSGDPVANTRIGIQRISRDAADIFVVETNDQGVYHYAHAKVSEVIVFMLDDNLSPTTRSIKLENAETTQDVTTSQQKPAPDELVAWLEKQARPLSGASASLHPAELAPFGDFVGDARVVALGEATHGSREFYQMKHRLFRYLVEHKGFTAIAFELSLPEAELINDYVLHGNGDPKLALSAPFFWVYNTEEVLELVEWMRAYNAEPGRKQKIQFVGFDLQFSDGAERKLFTYLRRVAPDYAASARTPLLPLLDGALTSRNPTMTPGQRKRVADGLAAIGAELNARRHDYVARSSEAAWQRAVQYLRILQQLHSMLGVDRTQARAIRDKSMADNTLWQLAQQPKGGRIALWAHNAHVRRVDFAARPAQGRFLAEALGEQYRSVGFVFHQGAFQAYDYTGPEKDGRGVREFRVGPGTPDDIGRNFARVGEPFFFLDLRAKLGRSRWLQSPHPHRMLGSGFVDDRNSTAAIELADAFDGVIFVDSTTRARPLHNEGWRYSPPPAR